MSAMAIGWITFACVFGGALVGVLVRPVLPGHHLSDEPDNPRKWAFPAGTTIAPGGYLLVWADEDGTATPGLHASFKLSADGEQIYLTDTDANLNAILDSITFGRQETDRSYGRSSANPDQWLIQPPTPGQANE